MMKLKIFSRKEQRGRDRIWEVILPIEAVFNRLYLSVCSGRASDLYLFISYSEDPTDAQKAITTRYREIKIIPNKNSLHASSRYVKSKMVWDHFLDLLNHSH